MDYNSYLMGVYGPRKNGKLCGYHTIAEEMRLLEEIHRYGFQCPPPRDLIVSKLDGDGQMNGEAVRNIALKHLHEIWPGYFCSGKHPLPSSDTGKVE